MEVLEVLIDDEPDYGETRGALARRDRRGQSRHDARAADDRRRRGGRGRQPLAQARPRRPRGLSGGGARRGAAAARLQSAKILDGSGAFLCEATIKDHSAAGLRLLLARNCGLPARFGVHLDLTGEILTVTQAWRRDRLVGVRVLALGPPAPIKASERTALAGRYYAVPN